MAEKGYEGPVEQLAQFDALVDNNPDVDRKGAKMPYTSRNGHMFCFLDASGVLALRLPSEMREDFLASYDSRIAEQHGTVMKEYVEVPDSLLADTDEMSRWFDASCEWIGTLKPKATTRQKKSEKS